MDTIEFVISYPDYISQLEALVKPEHLPAIEKLKALNPHDIVKPEHYFNSEAESVGVVFRLFLRQLSNYNNSKGMIKKFCACYSACNFSH